MKRFFSIALCIIFIGVFDACAQKLVILHVNDTHSHLEPERSDDLNGRGGFIEISAYVDSVRKAEGRRNVLLLHAGDWNQGTSYFNVFKGELEINILNAMKFDCVTLGNHEFDNGIEDLAMRLDRLDAEVVCANYDFSSLPLGSKVKPYTIVKRGGRKIGIIGATCKLSRVVDANIASRIPEIPEVEETVNKWADYLKKEKGCDMVILLSHMGYSADLSAVTGLRNVDLVIGGHSHTKLDGFKYVEDADGKEVPVIQDWEWGLEVGKIEVD